VFAQLRAHIRVRFCRFLAHEEAMQPAAMGLVAAWLVFVAVPTASSGSAAHSALVANPIQKVIEMLSGMLEKGKTGKHEEEIQFAAYKQWCAQTKEAKTAAVAEAAEQIELLKAEIQSYETNTAELQRNVQVLEADVATYNGDIKAATKVRELKAAEYEATHKDYTESIDAIGQAIQILRQQRKTRPQATELLQGIKLSQMVLVQAKPVIEAFLATAESQDPLADNPVAAPSAPESHGYEFQSQTIIDMLEKLQEKFTQERSNLEKEELSQRHAYELVMQDYRNSIETAEASVSAKNNERAKYLEGLAQKKGDLQDTTTSHAGDEKYIADITTVCSQKNTDFEERQKLRTEELVTIEKAIEIISGDSVLAAADKHLHPAMMLQRLPAVMFLQLRSSSENPSNQLRVAAYLNDEAKRIGSRALSALALRARDDPFAKVKQMIKDLITRLEQQVGEEATKKTWCEAELNKNENARKARTESVESLRNEIDQLEASIAKETAEIAELTANVADIDMEVTAKVELRTREKADNEVAIQDSKDAQVALLQAIAVLKEFYARAGQSTSLVQGQQGKMKQEPPPIFDSPYTGLPTSGGVIAMLEVIQSDFARLEADTTASEVTNAEIHNKFMRDSAVLKAEKQTSMNHKKGMVQHQQQSLADKRSDLSSEEKELAAANKYFDELKPSCYDTGMTYEQRNERRQEEIQSLQEALRILNGEDIASLQQLQQHNA